MCGIAGIIGRVDERNRAALQRMSDAMSHRGPDADGVWVDQNTGVAFGHRRLSIIDLSPMGAQPMHSASGRYVITFNGEIYNFKALRARELKLAAETAAEKVRRTGQPYSFAPMSSRERRMLHLAFRNYEDLETSSSGEGLRRFVVAYPKGHDLAKTRSRR